MTEIATITAILTGTETVTGVLATNNCHNPGQIC